LSYEDEVHFLTLYIPKKGRTIIKDFNSFTIKELQENVNKWTKKFTNNCGIIGVLKEIGTKAIINKKSKKDELIMKRDIESMINTAFFGKPIELNFVQKAIKLIQLKHVNNEQCVSFDINDNFALDFVRAFKVVEYFIEEREMALTPEQKKSCEFARLCGRLFHTCKESFYQYHKLQKGTKKAYEMDYGNINLALTEFKRFYVNERTAIETYRRNKFLKKNSGAGKAIMKRFFELATIFDSQDVPFTWGIDEKAYFFKGIDDEVKDLKQKFNEIHAKKQENLVK